MGVGKHLWCLYLWERDRHFKVNAGKVATHEVLKTLGRYQIYRIAIDASGRYEMAFATAAFEKGLAIAIVRWLLIPKFARAADQLAKTDKIAAQIIARFAAVLRLRLMARRSNNLPHTNGLVTRHRKFANMRTWESNRAKVTKKEKSRSCQR